MGGENAERGRDERATLDDRADGAGEAGERDEVQCCGVFCGNERDILGFLRGAEGVRHIGAEHRLLREARARVDQRSGRGGRKGEEVLSRNRERFLMQPPNVRA